MKPTYGGLPEKDAWHWGKIENQAIGSIVFKLFSQIPEKVKEAYIDFYELKRRFLPKEWDEKILALDTMRKETGRIPVLTMLNEVEKQMIKNGKISGPINTQLNERSSIMSGLTKLSEGLKLIGEAFQIMAAEIDRPGPAAISKDPAPVEEEKKAAAAKPEKQKPAEVLAAEEPPKDLREACKTKIIALARDDKAAAKAALESVGASKLTEVKDEDLDKLYKALSK